MTRTMAVDVEYWPTLDPSLTQGSRERCSMPIATCKLRQRLASRFGTQTAGGV